MIQGNSEIFSAIVLWGICTLSGVSAFPLLAQDPPKDSPAFTRQGIMSIRAGKYEEGMKSLDQAIQEDSKNSMAYYWRGRAKSDLGNYKDAITDFDKVIELDPDEPTAYVARAEARKKLGDETGTKKDMDFATKLEPDYLKPPEAVTPQLSDKPPERGKKLPLVDMMGKLIDLSADELTAEKHYQQGNAKLNLNEYQKAVNHFDKAVQLNPKDVAILKKRGYAKYKLGDLQGAMADAKKAVQLNPTFSMLTGPWEGPDWGHVTLIGTWGTYEKTNVNGGPPGLIELRKTGDRTYQGTWGESTQRHGTLEITLSEDGKTITGTWQPDPDSVITRLKGGPLQWTRQ